MRPIDADELKEHVYRDRLDSRERIANLIDLMPTVQPELDPEWRRKHYEMSYNQGFVDGCKSYEKQPERKKGKWVGVDSQCGIGCPFCGTPVDDFCSSIDYIDLCYEPNFCPNCGCRMKEGD